MKTPLLKVAVAAVLMTAVGQLAFATLPVFDYSNFSQNILTAMGAVKGEIYQDTNIAYQYQMMQNQLLQATNLNPTAMKAQYDQISSDLSQVNQLNTTLTQLYGGLQQGQNWMSHVQSLISASGKSPEQWYSDMQALYTQGNSVATNLFNMGNNVMTHAQQLAQRRQQLQSQMALSPTQQATAELTTHYLDVVSSQMSDLIQMTAAKQQQSAQQTSVSVTNEAAKAAAMQSFTAEQAAERAALNSALGQ